MTMVINAPKAGDDAIKDSTTASFMADVIDASRTTPVIVDFWAPWCNPCKTLGPALEKAVRATKGAVRMVKIDIDRNPELAQQMRIQSIPAVYAFFQGRPVDGFAGAIPDSQLKVFVDRLTQLAGGVPGAQDLQAVLDEAKQAMDAGDLGTAGAIYQEILGVEPAHAGAYAGLMRVLIAAGDLENARQMLDAAPADIAKNSELAAARTALELAEQSQSAAGDGDNSGALAAQVAHDPDNHQARFDLAMAHFAAGRREGAMDELLELVRRDRTWNEEAARKQLVKLFEAFGPTDKLTIAGRRRLSSILFS